MKKILAVILAAIMTLSMVISAVAADDKLSSDASIEVIDEQVEDLFESFANSIKKVIHKIVHLLAKFFDIDCPFCDEDDSDNTVTPEEPTTVPETTTQANSDFATSRNFATITVTNI